jgi:hypothetical protein
MKSVNIIWAADEARRAVHNDDHRMCPGARHCDGGSRAGLGGIWGYEDREPFLVQIGIPEMESQAPNRDWLISEQDGPHCN